MELRLEQPGWLWLVVVLVPMVIIALWWFATMSSARRWSAIVFRTALVLLLAAALGELGKVQRSDSLAVVAVVDTSDSVRRLGPQAGTLTLEKIQSQIQALEGARGSEDLLGIVAFDSQARTVSLPRAVKGAARPLDGGDGKGTNIQRAIEHAAALLPPEAAGRLVLFSDGNQTAGDAVDAARRAASLLRKGVGGKRGISIDVVPIDYNVKNEVVVEPSIATS